MARPVFCSVAVTDVSRWIPPRSLGSASVPSTDTSLHATAYGTSSALRNENPARGVPEWHFYVYALVMIAIAFGAIVLIVLVSPRGCSPLADGDMQSSQDLGNR